MCKCNNIEVWSYKRQTNMKSPYSDKWLCIDTCLVQEIAELWYLWIRTTWCCCGHNLETQWYIWVEEKFINKMIELWYKTRINETDITRKDSFIPKTKYE